MLWSTVKMQERHDQRIENIASGLERIKQEHAGQQPQKIDECYGDCPTDSTTCTNPCRFDGRASRAPADNVPASVLDSLALMKVVMRADEALSGRCARGTTNWAAAIGKAVQDAVLAARAPADSVPAAQFDDPKVQAVYAILCDDADPPKGEHWEGFAARRIVDALSAGSWIAR